MAVFFVFRSHYDEPSGKLLKRFADATVLDWFRNQWANVNESDVYTWGARLLGYGVDPFIELFRARCGLGLPAPETYEQLDAYLREHIESEVTILCHPNLLTIRSVDECNMEACSYLFDDDYLAQHQKRAAFLLHEGWKLPSGHDDAGGFEPEEPIDATKPRGDGSGTTYFVNLYYDYENEGNLTELWGPVRIDGVRLPDLVSWLGPADRSPIDELYLLLLRSQLFAAPFTADPLEEGFRQVLLTTDEDVCRSQAAVTWRAYCDWLQETRNRPVGLLFLKQALKALSRLPVARLPEEACGAILRCDPFGTIRQQVNEALAKNPPDADQLPLPKLCKVHVEQHMAQLCLNTEHWRTHRRSELYYQWIFFDDLWAAAHPDLANAILRYARCWDVLSPDGPHDAD